ncbi:MAG: VWA domain-containing protein [Bdellovibrionales bacterium]|nr:VWA domain-containing protein [Bdellovibrionales bacterium]
MVGDTIFSPSYISLFTDLPANQWVYFHQICFAFMAQQHGYCFNSSKMTAAKRLTLTLAAAPSILASMHDRFAGLYQQSSNYYQKYLEISPTVDQLISDCLDSSNDPCCPLTPKQLVNEASRIHQHILSFSQKNDFENSFSLPPFFTLIPVDTPHLTTQTSKIEDGELSNSSPSTTVKTNPKEIVKRVDLEEDDGDYNPATLLMESIKTAERYQGGMKRVDGSDELGSHADALEELDINEVVRSSHQVKSIFQADIAYEVIVQDEDGQLEKSKNSFIYNEWNFRKKSYLKNWCVVSEICPAEVESSEICPADFIKQVRESHGKHIKELRHRIEQIALSRQWRNRQYDGEEIDLDAVIDAITSIRSGHSPSEKLYQRRHKSLKDISMLILLDASLSSDSWVEGRRVMDIAKETVAILAEVLDGMFEEVAIMAFNGKTRRECQYHIIKEFNHSWNSSLPRLIGIAPDGYTRIGAALRHSLNKIEHINTNKRVIVLLSDGKPTDYDTYEGKYGIHDVRQVVREAKQKNIDVFSLAIDQDAKYYFPQMFGKNNYKILNHPQQLPDHFISLLSTLL